MEGLSGSHPGQTYDTKTIFMRRPNDRLNYEIFHHSWLGLTTGIIRRGSGLQLINDRGRGWILVVFSQESFVRTINF